MSQSGSLPATKLYPLDSPSNEAGNLQWKQEVNQRLAAHRSRRGPQDQAAGREAEHPRTASARAAEAQARVAARYAKAPSYSQLLAGEAREAARAASAAAEAARNAQAAAEAVLAGLESGLRSDMEPGHPASRRWESEEPDAAAEPSAMDEISAPAPSRWQDEPPAHLPTHAVTQKSPWAGAQPRWEEALPVPVSETQNGRDIWSEMRVHPAPEPSHGSRQDQERISMRRYRRGQERDLLEGELFPEDPYNPYDPMGSATIEPVQHLPANLIEFPRELVATRKARPRLAEGPFYDASHENSQLSIFEVDPDSLTAPVYPADTATGKIAPPEWASIELDHPPEHRISDVPGNRHSYAEDAYVAAAEIPAGYAIASRSAGTAVEELATAAGLAVGIEEKAAAAPAQASAANIAPAAELLVARLSDRLLAGLIDGALVTLAFLAAAVVVIASTTHPPAGRLAMAACGCGWLLFWLLYQYLFLSYAEEGTPGMRYARIALCTFEDNNPAVEQMRGRIPAMLLATLPAGMGLMWAIFDKDRLGWHDRMTKTYQRKY